MQFRVLRSEETPVEQTKFAKTMRDRTRTTALALRALFLEYKSNQPNASSIELRNQVVAHSADLTPIGTALYQAAIRKQIKPLSKEIVTQYLHGKIGGGSAGSEREVIGEDLAPDLRPARKPAPVRKFGTMQHYNPEHSAISLTPILDRLDAIDSHLQALAEGRTEYQTAVMEKLTQLISLWADD